MQNFRLPAMYSSLRTAKPQPIRTMCSTLEWDGHSNEKEERLKAFFAEPRRGPVDLAAASPGLAEDRRTAALRDPEGRACQRRQYDGYPFGGHHFFSFFDQKCLLSHRKLSYHEIEGQSKKIFLIFLVEIS